MKQVFRGKVHPSTWDWVFPGLAGFTWGYLKFVWFLGPHLFLAWQKWWGGIWWFWFVVPFFSFWQNWSCCAEKRRGILNLCPFVPGVKDEGPQILSGEFRLKLPPLPPLAHTHRKETKEGTKVKQVFRGKVHPSTWDWVFPGLAGFTWGYLKFVWFLGPHLFLAWQKWWGGIWWFWFVVPFFSFWQNWSCCAEKRRGILNLYIYIYSHWPGLKKWQSEASRALSIRQSGAWMLEVVSYEPQDPRAKCGFPKVASAIVPETNRCPWGAVLDRSAMIQGPASRWVSASHPMAEGWLTQDHDRWYYGHINLFLHLKCLPFTFI